MTNNTDVMGKDSTDSKTTIELMKTKRNIKIERRRRNKKSRT